MLLSFREKLENILNNSFDEKNFTNRSNDLDRKIHKTILYTSIKLRKNNAYHKKNNSLTIVNNNNNSFIKSKNYFRPKSLLKPKFEELFTVKKFRNETNIPVLNTLFRSLTLKDIHNRIEKPNLSNVFTTIDLSNNYIKKKKVYEIKDYISMNYNKNDYSLNRPLSKLNQNIFSFHSKQLSDSISPSTERLKKYYKKKKKISNYFIKPNIKKYDENNLKSRNFKYNNSFKNFTNEFNNNLKSKYFFNNRKNFFNGCNNNIL